MNCQSITGSVRERYLLLFLILVLLCPLPGGAFQANSTAWMAVDYSSFLGHLQSLAGDEQVEQLRDWALLAAYQDIDPTAKNANDTLFTVLPLRIDYLGPLNQHRFGPTRWLALADQRVLAMIPDAAPDSLAVLGRIADQYRVNSGAPPATVVVYRYRVGDKDQNLSILRDKEVPGPSLFTEAAGYYEQPIASIAALDSFLKANLDLVFVRNLGSQLLAGGRRHAKDMRPLVTISDLAAMAKAGVGLPDMVRAHLERDGLRETYEQRINQAISGILAENPSKIRNYGDIEALRATAHQVVPYDKFLSEQVEGAISDHPPGLGFSLDPRVNYANIAADLRNAASGNEAFYRRWLLPKVRAAVERGQHVQTDSMQKMLEAFRKLESEEASSSQAQPETDLGTLTGTATPAPNRKAAPVRTDADTRLVVTPKEIEDATNELVEQMRVASLAKSEELADVANALASQNITPLLDLERYLDADIVGITIRAGSPKYSVADLQQMLADNSFDLKVDGSYGPKTEAAIRQYQTENDLKATGVVDVGTWKALLSGDDAKQDELDSLHDLLTFVKQNENFQCARYDGVFSNTEVGMTLFYTDLVMKLWSLANPKQTPSVKGFVPETQYEVAPIYWDDIKRHNATRGWLGGKLESIGYYDGGARTYFAPIATRLYNASSSDLYPGVEVPANFQAERFSSWWNNHYAEVADFEPQYHRLNQLMKWSAVLQPAPHKPPLPAFLNSLSAVDVPAARPFPEWWAAHPELKVRWDVRFLNNLPAETTECMELISSDPFPTMGGLYTISGGVTLFETGELDAKVISDRSRDALSNPQWRAAGGVFDKVVEKAGVTTVPLENKAAYEHSAIGSAYVPAPEQRFEGQTASIPAGRISTRVQPSAAGYTMRVSRETGPLATVNVARSGQSFRLTGSAPPEAAAVRFLSSSGTGGSGGDNWTRIDLSDDQFLLQSKGAGNWLLVSTGQKGAKAGVTTAIGEVPGNIRVAPDGELQSKAHDLPWIQVAEEFGSYDSALVSAAPGDARDVRISIAGATVSAKANRQGLYLARGAGNFDGSLAAWKDLLSQLRPEELSDIIDAVGTPSAVGVARRSRSGALLLADFGGDGGGGLGDPSLFEGMVPSNGKVVMGVLLRDKQEAGLKVSGGLLEIPKSPSPETLALAKRLAAVAEAKPSAGELLQKLAVITPENVAALETLPERRAATYVEFASVPADKLGSTVLADLSFTADDPHIVIRQGDKFTIDQVANARELAAERDYVDKVASRSTPELAAVTVAELRDKTQQYFAFLDGLRTRFGARRFFTRETGQINAETVYRIHGGDPDIEFPRDIPDARTSVDHLASKIQPAVSHSVVASTVLLSGAQATPGLQNDLDVLDSLLVRVNAPVSYPAFAALLDDKTMSQITLIVRADGDSLRFADRPVSLKTIAADVADIPKKDFLHLITNGGQEVVDAFAESGKFKRILVTRYQLGDFKSFEQACRRIADYFQSFGVSTAVWRADDFAGIKALDKEASALLDQSTAANGDEVQTDVSTLVKRGREQKLDWAAEPFRNILEALRARLRTKPGADLDSSLQELNAAVLASNEDPKVRLAGTALQGITQGKHE